MKLSRATFRVLLCSATLFGAAPAAAQGKPAEEPYVTKSDSSDSATYEVKFIDDPLDALPASTYIARIRVATGRVRVLLTRPRTSFVKEMLVSVQTL